MDAPAADRLLAAYSIPVSQWGTGVAKALDDLYNELRLGESQLVEQDGALVRLISGVSVRIYSQVEGKRMLLKEDRQVFSDGRVRRREITGLGEKMGEGELSLAAARRVFTEELGIHELVPLVQIGEERRGPMTSNSFPGLLTKYETFLYESDMPAHLYREEYQEIQPTKTSYFRWVEA
jgi:hypothetical protein